jgi:hypothetical protein
MTTDASATRQAIVAREELEALLYEKMDAGFRVSELAVVVGEIATRRAVTELRALAERMTEAGLRASPDWPRKRADELEDELS